MTITTKDKLQCATRELGMRRRNYPRWIQGGSLTEEAARREIELMTAIVEDYKAKLKEEVGQGELI